MLDKTRIPVKCYEHDTGVGRKMLNSVLRSISSSYPYCQGGKEDERDTGL